MQALKLSKHRYCLFKVVSASYVIKYFFPIMCGSDINLLPTYITPFFIEIYVVTLQGSKIDQEVGRGRQIAIITSYFSRKEFQQETTFFSHATF